MFEMVLSIDRGEKTVCSRDWAWQNIPGRYTGFNLWVVLEGEGRLQTPRADYNLGAGDCFLLGMHEPIRGSHNPNRPLVVSWICFDSLDARGRAATPEACPRPREHRRIVDLFFLDQLMQRVMELHAGKEQRSAESWLHVALLEAMKNDDRAQLSGLELEHAMRIDSLCVMMRERPEQFTGISQMAVVAHCSVDHFIRIFRRLKAVTPWEFMIRCRIEKACNLLRFSSHPVSRIADILGYADIYSFSKQFKDRTGCSPTEYRRE
jgi:AraC family transcriptional regulator, arabinose operon regulatory protein